MSFPTPEEIKAVAIDHGYVERRDEVSYTLFFKERSPIDADHPILINVFYTTRGIMTKIPHPTSGYNELWRSSAYDSVESLSALFSNPRTHTGKGYRQAEKAVRGCSQCGIQKERADFTKNQWRKGPGHSKCSACVDNSGNIDSETASTTQQQNIMEISRDCIKCDSDGCDQSSPRLRCSKCELVYYCSPECQKRHARSHSAECSMGAKMRDMFAMHGNPSEDMKYGRAMAAQLAGRRDFEGRLLQAYYWQRLGNWEGAIEMYQSVFDESYYRSPAEQREIIMGVSRCFYEIGKYDHAIELGLGAIEMNRHFPQVHKYVALALKAKGDIEAARRTMSQAVLYETPWDDENIEANRTLLKQL